MRRQWRAKALKYDSSDDYEEYCGNGTDNRDKKRRFDEVREEIIGRRGRCELSRDPLSERDKRRYSY